MKAIRRPSVFEIVEWTGDVLKLPERFRDCIRLRNNCRLERDGSLTVWLGMSCCSLTVPLGYYLLVDDQNNMSAYQKEALHSFYEVIDYGY